jgi:hypothetical protein
MKRETKHFPNKFLRLFRGAVGRLRAAQADVSDYRGKSYFGSRLLWASLWGSHRIHH